MGKKSMSGRKLTFLLITIPIVALFFCFNTLPLIKGVPEHVFEDGVPKL